MVYSLLYETQRGLQLEFEYQDFYAGIRAGNQVFHLKLVGEQDPSIQFLEDRELFHRYVETNDVRTAAVALKANGLPIVKDVHETPWGTREVVIKDDQGHTLYLGESRQAANSALQPTRCSARLNATLNVRYRREFHGCFQKAKTAAQGRTETRRPS